ncbi:uncharacterized protein LOC134132719 [Pungitius pungitius]|uniref:uncharacterized protein LOC134132719 n=1 Tax=Pungitius pungitius TaxID=134920 RepID=UPI002E11E0C2
MTDKRQQDMPTQPALALAQMIGELAGIQREQAEANCKFMGMLQVQVGRQAQALEQLVERSRPAPPPPGPTALASLTLHRMTAEDDAQAFMEAFEATAEACGWPEGEWAVRLLPLLTGEAQTAAMGLPPAARRDYPEVRKAVVDRLGLLPEDHRRRFRSARMGPEDRPFAYGQRLRDAAARWLQPNGAGTASEVVEKVVLEQFVEGLPARTAAWVRYHRSPTLQAATTLAEDWRCTPAGGATGRACRHPAEEQPRHGDGASSRPRGSPYRPHGGRRSPYTGTPQPQQAPAPFLTRREVLERQGRSAGGAGSPVTCGGSAR